MRPFPMLALLAACGTPEIDRAPVSDDTRAAIEQVNSFGMRFATTLRDAQPNGAADNFVYSPLSISVPLAMIYAGARSTTADELRAVLGQEMDDDAYQDGFGAAVRDLADAGTQFPDRVWELRVSNHLYGEATYTFEPDWLALLEDTWQAPLVQTDFFGNSAGAQAVINAQIAADTDGHIDDLLPPGALDATTKLVAVNALYFSGKWETAFEVDRTEDADFTLLDGSVIRVPTMNATVPGKAGCDAVVCVGELPYIGGQIVLDLLVPVAPDGLAALEDAIVADGLDSLLGSLQPVEELIVSLPRMDLTTDTDLEAPLTALGMPSAFDQVVADFSGISPLALAEPRLHVDRALHRTWVHIDEEGTKAAAATAITLAQNYSLEATTQIIADHPFLLLIRDTVTGAVLFVGHVADPSLAE
ncbi:MAG: serpin family protein [Pseudomonadota bacterium]|nr:serpin family protein [Pseudomonadota bacterium]